MKVGGTSWKGRERIGERRKHAAVTGIKAISCFLSLRKSIFNYICIYSTRTPKIDYWGKGKWLAGERGEQERASRDLNMIKDKDIYL